MLPKNLKTNVQLPIKSWVFMLKDELLKSSEYINRNTDETPDIVTLRHPSTGESAVFLFSHADNLVYEILTYSEVKRSWFIDQSVKSDGKLNLATPMDPIFLVLPYLKKHGTNQAMPLDQLLQDDKYPKTERLLKCSGLQYLTLIADKKSSGDITAFKYNEEKTLVWLKKKSIHVANVLQKKNIDLSTSAAVLDESTDGLSNDTAYLQYAAGIVSDYLMEDLSRKLFKYLNLSEDSQRIPKRKSKANDDSLHQTKKPKSKEDSRKGRKSSEPRLSSKEKSQAKKVTTGTKSIASYFKKS